MLYKIFSVLKRVKSFSVVALLSSSALDDSKDRYIPKISKYRIIDKIIHVFKGKSVNHNDLSSVISGPRNVGLLILVLFFGVFGVWAVFAPLEGAVVANGEMIIKSDKKVIQHLEGGIVKDILVQEGDSVIGDQHLIHINDVNIRSQLKILTERLNHLRITESRLIAERDGIPDIELPHGFSVDDHDVKDIIHNQEMIFKSHINGLSNQISIVEKRIDQTNNEIAALNSQLESMQKQLSLIEDELVDKRQLFIKNIINKNQITALEHENIKLIGRISEVRFHIAKAGQRVTESELEILNIKNKFHSEVVNEIKEVSSMVHEIQEKLSASQDIFRRTVISAPQSGKVTGLRFNTIGGIIPPGATIMEITPENQDMIVEAKIFPHNIEAVISSQANAKNNVNFDGVSGILSRVRLTAFSPRRVGLLNAVMTYISADTITDNRSGMRYYLAHFKIPNSEIVKIKGNVKLYPGMPAVVYISTESRTLLSYLLSPIISTMDNAFLEK